MSNTSGSGFFKNGRALVAWLALAVTLIGTIFWSGYSWAQVSEIDHRVISIEDWADSHDNAEDELREMVIRMDGRLCNIEDDIDDISEAIRND